MAYQQGQQQGDREFLSVVAWVGPEGKRKAIDIGYAYVGKSGHTEITIRSIPMGWDGKATVKPREQRGQGGGSYQGGQQRAPTAPAARPAQEDDVPY